VKLAPALVAAVLVLSATGCSDVEGTGDQGYVTGDGIVVTVALDDREGAVTYDGEDLEGNALSLADHRGETVVLVVWGSWCGDCRVEAPMVQKAADELGDRVQFLGLNLRDANAAQAQAYVRNFGIDYPSFFSPDGDFIEAFPGVLTIQTIPAFVVLDGEGRVAASILGRLPSTQTLVDVASDVAGERADGPANG
jgi:thiol-disulfide isomerase/thioredoxin